MQTKHRLAGNANRQGQANPLGRQEGVMIYRVTYQSMTAFYGPSFIEADSEYEARRKFAGSAFSAGEMSLIKAREVPGEELTRALRGER